jgi:cyclic pyranopterin phosphate synthase
MSMPLVQVYSRPGVCFKETSAPLRMPRLRLLRLSVTDFCNFRCRYCMPEQGVPKSRRCDLLTLEELASLTAWVSTHTGINRVRLTGGEPLVRPGIEHLIAEISTFPGMREVSLTTNGSLLSRMAWSLKAAGLGRVNISLDSLDEERFKEVTRGGSLKRTLQGIKAARDAGLTPIKLNTVLQRSTWKQELPRLLDYAASTGFEIRFIELMRMGTERVWCDSEFISVDEVCKGLGTKIVPAEEQTAAPARTTLLDWRGASVKVGWITPRSHPFCQRCERLRMDARGRIRRCLMDPATLDLPHTLETMDEVSASQEFQRYVAGKVSARAMDSSFAMSQIGG